MRTAIAIGPYNGMLSANASHRNGAPPLARFAKRFQVACATADAKTSASANAVTAGS